MVEDEAAVASKSRPRAARAHPLEMTRRQAEIMSRLARIDERAGAMRWRGSMGVVVHGSGSGCRREFAAAPDHDHRALLRRGSKIDARIFEPPEPFDLPARDIAL